MADIMIKVTEYQKTMFVSIVGKGNMSGTIRNFIEATIETGTPKKENKEHIIIKKIELIKPKKEEIDKEFSELKNKLLVIQEKNKSKEIKRLEEEEKERKKFQRMKHDTIKAHLDEVV